MRLRFLSALAVLPAVIHAACAPAPVLHDVSTPAYVQRIAADQLDTWRGVHYDGLVIDVRNPNEWVGPLVPLPNSVFIPAAELAQRIGEIESYSGKPVLILDRAGESAVSAAQVLVNRGFRDVTALDGGIQAYRALYPEPR